MAAATDDGEQSVRKRLLREIGARQGESIGASLGGVVEEVAVDYRLNEVLEALATLHAEGEVYQPASDQIKHSSLPDDFTSLVDPDTIACAECGDIVDADLIEDNQCPGCRYGGGQA